MKKHYLAIVILCCVCALPFNAAAGEATVGDYGYDASRQFGRGLVNIVSSLAEIPCTMTSDIKEKGGVGAATGFGTGLWYTVRRLLVGTSEVVTFFMPAPSVLPPVCQESNPNIS